MFSKVDKVLYKRMACRIEKAGTHARLVQEIGMSELINHLSTVMFAVAELNNSWTFPKTGISIRVGESSPIQARMVEEEVDSLIAVTPKFPLHNREASPAENEFYCQSLKWTLQRKGIDYTEAFGTALDFAPSTGCFILIGVTVPEVKELLAGSQLSIIHLPARGVAELVSCLD